MSVSRQKSINVFFLQEQERTSVIVGWRKPILGLILLLTAPCLGGGRVQASFALAPSMLSSESKHLESGFELRLLLGGEFQRPVSDPLTSTGSGREEHSLPSERPWPTEPSPSPLSALTGYASNGCGTTETSSGNGFSPGVVFIVSLDFQSDSREAAGRLQLLDDRWKPHTIASRLFRPPR